MADKMMRMAGRNPNGLAKPIQTDNSGNISAKLLGDDINLKNLNSNSDFSNGVFGWIGSNATLSALNGKAIMRATAQNGQINNQFINRIINHKYYIAADIKSNSASVGLHSSGVIIGGTQHSGDGTTLRKSAIFTAPSSTANWTMGVVDGRASGWDDIEIDNYLTINLTECFGVGKEPTVGEVDAMLSDLDNRWFTGEKTLSKKIVPPNASQIDSIVNQYSKVLETMHHAGASTNSNGVEINVAGYSSILFNVDGAFKANLHFECQYSDVRGWRKLNVVDVSTGETVQKLTAGQTETGMYRADISGFKRIRVRISRYHSGTITVESRCTVMPTSDGSRVQLIGNTTPGKPIQTFDIATRKAYPKNYAQPFLENKSFGVRGYDKKTNVLYGINPANGNQLLSSADNLQTITTGHTFEYNIQKVVVSDTHILVSIFDEPTFGLGKVYKTLKVNGVAGPFAEVEGLNLSEFVYVTQFGFNSYYDYTDSTGKSLRNYVFLSQYGSKTAIKQAVEVYMSKNGGDTFTKIYTGAQVNESHMHTVTYDKYMDRIWISNGDYGARTIAFSDDHGATWETAVVDFWPTIIIPMPKYVIFGSDSYPMGLHRWNRAKEEYERTIEGGKISKAFEANWYPVRGNLAGESNFAADYAQEDDWTFYIPFMGAGSNRKSFLLGTGDGGETAHILWMDRTDPASGFGSGVFGTLPDGSMISHYTDSKRVNGETVFRIPKIDWVSSNS